MWNILDTRTGLVVATARSMNSAIARCLKLDPMNTGRFKFVSGATLAPTKQRQNPPTSPAKLAREAEAAITRAAPAPQPADIPTLVTDNAASQYIRDTQHLEKLSRVHPAALVRALCRELLAAVQPVQPDTYHLRRYGDVTKAQMDEYIATGAIKYAQPVQPAEIDEKLCALCGEREGLHDGDDARCPSGRWTDF